MTIKSTYALDPETVRILEDLARAQGVSKSQVLRCAIRQAAAVYSPSPVKTVETLHRLQKLVSRDRGAVSRWRAESRRERRAASERRERGRR